jgi:hypothetical protein
MGFPMHYGFRLLLPLTMLFALAGEAMAQAATIVFATGGASIVAADGSTRRAERGTALVAGETVDTGEGKAQLRFRDGATISLQPGTQFRIEQFRFSEQNGRAAEEDLVVMRFFKGALRAVSGLIGKQKREQYRMDTAVGTIGIRGTEYASTMGADGLSVTTHAGLVEVCNTVGCSQVGPGQTLVVPDANTRPRLLPGSGQSRIAPTDPVPQLPPVQMQVPVAPQEVHMPQQSPQTFNSPGHLQ